MIVVWTRMMMKKYSFFSTVKFSNSGKKAQWIRKIFFHCYRPRKNRSDNTNINWISICNTLSSLGDLYDVYLTGGSKRANILFYVGGWGVLKRAVTATIYFRVSLRYQFILKTIWCSIMWPLDYLKERGNSRFRVFLFGSINLRLQFKF